MLAGEVGRLVDFPDEVGAGIVEDRLAAAGRGVQGVGEEAGAKLAGLLESAGLEVEADGDGCEDDAVLGAAELDEGAVDVIGRSGGAEGEGGAGLGRHAGEGVSKKKEAPRRE